MSDKLLKMGAVGEEDAILAFKAIGAVAVPATTPEQISRALFRLARENTPVIFITETAARLVPEAIARFESTMEVAVIPIPGIKGSDGYGEQRVRENVIKAIGADILTQNN